MLISALLTLSTAAVPEETVRLAAGRRALFGHQSVGENIIAGLRDVAGAALPIREGRAATDFVEPGFVHTRLGRNQDPRSKLADFEAALAASEGKPGVALFKFCYVDIDAKTDVDALFEATVATMERLRAQYPSVRFIYVTVPLTVVQTGLKAWLTQRVTGAAPWGFEENLARHRFNTLLRTRLRGAPLFDLAALESTRTDGTVELHAVQGQTVPALVPAYSDDGQHLNAEGRRRVAEALLETLAALP